MFTGLIAELGTVETIETGDAGARIRIAAGLAAELDRGDSIAVSGACLTASTVERGEFEADVMLQTLELTTLGSLAEGDRVNLELPLRPTDRLGGHIVQGHVDGTGTVMGVEPDGFARRVEIEGPDELMPLVVDRGSIAVEGVSLTVARLGESSFEVALIPETLETTTLGAVEPGRKVNLECDLVARYVQRLFPTMSTFAEEAEGQ